MSLYPNSIPRCEHLKVNGTQCGSPALRRNHFCYFHKNWQEARIVLNANRARRGRAFLDLPVLEDANSIQVSLMQIMRLILSGQIDPKTAGLLLYALQTASSNLKRINFEPVVKTRVVIDPKTVDQTPLGEDPWNREDFEEEEYEEDNQDEVRERIEAKSQDLGEDKEWTAEETIPDIEAQAEPAEKSEQIIPQIQAVANTATRPPRPRSPGRPRPGGLSHADRDSDKCMRVTQHSRFRLDARDSRAAHEQNHAGHSRFAGTTSTGPISLPPPAPLLSESTYDERS
jgi:hypothetical protein